VLVLEYLNNMMQSLTKKWEELSKKTKLIIMSSAGAIVIFISICLAFALKTDYTLLYNEDIDFKSIDVIRTTLSDAGIKYKLSSSGRNIMVDTKKLGEAKIKISASELPSSKYTWKDALDKNTLGMTQSEKAMNYKYAAEQTLASDIANIENVQSANVNLILPESDPFVLKQTTTSQAAVQVKLSKPLNDKQIRGIAKHVQMSVEGLEEGNISITDTDANVLFPFNDSTLGQTTFEYDELKYSRQEIIEKKVNALLAPIYDDVRVYVNLQMNFDKYKEKNEIYSSSLGEDAKVGLISEQHIEKQEGTSTTVAGEPGLGSNDSDTSYQMEDNGSTDSNSSESSDTIYKLNTKTTELEKQIGEVSLEDSSISVVVYKNQLHHYNVLAKNKKLKNTTWKEYKENVKAKNTKLEIDKDLIEAIQKATGINQVSVKGYVTPIFIDKEESGFEWVNILPIIVLLLVIIAVAVILVKKSGSVNIVETEPELSVESLLYSTKNKENDLPEIQEHLSDSFVRISEFIDNKPDLVAQLLRNWINEN